MKEGGFRFENHEVTLTGSPATPEDLGQGWRGSQVPALADFDEDGFLDLFVSRQAPLSNGEVRIGPRGVYADRAYKSGNPLEGHFGLGANEAADLKVFPPTARRFTLPGIKGGRYLDLNLADGTLRMVRTSPGAAQTRRP